MKNWITFISFLLPVSLMAQKIEVLAGSPENVFQVKVYSLSMNWDDLQVRDVGTEEDIKQKTIDEFNRETEGTGEDWEAEWEEKKAKKYPGKFTRSFNKIMIKQGCMIATRSYEGEIDGRIEVETEEIHLGWAQKRKLEAATVTAVVSFYDEDDELLFRIRLVDCPGMPSSTTWMNATPWYATFERIHEAYAKCGKECAIFIEDNVKKKK